ncbi:MAG: DUF89 family protein [Bradymonadales bacterium]|nr:DUF89 family protein [Bradymonadales bacterium]
MKTYLDCIPCLLRQSLEAARNVTEDVQVHQHTIRHVLRVIAELDLHLPPPSVSQLIHRKLRELTGVADPYQDAKKRHNQLAMGVLTELSADLDRSPDPLQAAARLAMAANLIDLSVPGSLSEPQVLAALRESGNNTVHGDWAAFHRETAAASTILFLADNAGEIAIDRLLVQALGPERVTVAVRGGPVINDATLEDAREVRMHELVEVIDNGSDAPGTILADCSSQFRERFHQADLIIAKGQGNFETLSGVNAKIFFLFKVKCPVTAEHAGLPLGTLALLYSRELPATNLPANEERCP